MVWTRQVRAPGAAPGAFTGPIHTSNRRPPLRRPAPPAVPPPIRRERSSSRGFAVPGVTGARGSRPAALVMLVSGGRRGPAQQRERCRTRVRVFRRQPARRDRLRCSPGAAHVRRRHRQLLAGFVRRGRPARCGGGHRPRAAPGGRGGGRAGRGRRLHPPGAAPVDAEEERRRVLPVVEALAAAAPPCPSRWTPPRPRSPGGAARGGDGGQRRQRPRPPTRTWPTSCGSTAPRWC